MGMYDTIKDFATQFAYEPAIENGKSLGSYRHFIIAGMGGSGLAARLIKMFQPALPMTIHQEYGLPALSDSLFERGLFIANSYSGNTEETLDALYAAEKRGISCAVVATGGELLAYAREKRMPYIVMPATGIQPRTAIGFNVKALLRLIGAEPMLKEISALATTLAPLEYEEAGNALAKKFKGRVPVIYASKRNDALAYVWKIALNETGKIPSFANVVPELNHNEMTGFDVQRLTAKLSKSFHFIFLCDPDDHPRIVKRMGVLSKLYRDRGLAVETVALEGQNRFHLVFASIVLSWWMAYHTAQQYKVDPEQVPMVEEFKKLIA